MENINLKQREMKTISGKIFIVKVAVERQQEDGLVKKVKEEYSVKAVSFTDCEAKITQEAGSADNVKDTFEVLSEAIAPYREVFLHDEGEKYYKVKVVESTIDEVTGKEKKTATYYLVNADTLEQARKRIEQALGDTLTDYAIAAVIEQNTVGVIE